MSKINEAALTLQLTKTEQCAKEIDRILDEVYNDIRNTPLMKKIKSALIEASKKIIKIRHEKITKESVQNYARIIDEVKN
jgi:hypothetical protein